MAPSRFFFSIVLILLSLQLFCQSKPFVTHPSQLEDERFAEWIVPEQEHGVFLFRKPFSIKDKPEEFIIHVSADARYKLYVNGMQVCWGPAVGDLENWNYETIDIAPYLIAGNNILAARVWNNGRLNGTKQLSERTALIVQGNSEKEQIINTGKSWRVLKDAGYYPLTMTDQIAGGGFIAGGTDSLVAEKHPWGWLSVDFDDTNWPFARETGKGNHSGLDTWKGTAWKLKPRSIPFMTERKEPIASLLNVEGIPSRQHPGQKWSFEIPPYTRAEILLDNEVLTMGYPQLHVSGGKHSHIKVQYQEAMFDDDGVKRHRDDWQGKTMKGIYDVFMPDGESRLLETLWIRVFRYIKITIETQDSPITIHDFYNIYTAYPLEQNGSFSAKDTVLERIWDVSWRTQELCALESYWDCPYYEQVQYIGDTRIQALNTMFIDGDDRLARNAIEQFYGSMQPMGLTKSAHPTSGVQIIPPFSLVFIGMIHDYYMMRDDQEFVRQFVPGIRFILEWFISRIDENGIMGPLPFWNHIDGGTDFVNGSPPGISDGGSAHMTLLLAYAMDKAIEMLEQFGFTCDVERYTIISENLKANTLKHCFDPTRSLIAETPAKKQFSQHTNIFAVLTGTFNDEESKRVMQQVVEDETLIQTTLYFKFYLFQALKKANMGEKMLNMMHHWQFFIDHGFTTFPEHGLHSRSDCHAWSSHPMLGFLNIICGIGPGSPGFKTVEIRPATGHFEQVNGRVPHPLGMIDFTLTHTSEGKKSYDIILPAGLTGEFIVDDTKYPLKSEFTRIIID